MCKKIKKENTDFKKKTEKQIQKKLKGNYKMQDTSSCIRGSCKANPNPLYFTTVYSCFCCKRRFR